MNITKLAWGARVSPEFRERHAKMCDNFGWNEERACENMACIAFETAETFSPGIKNAAGSGAIGLIQFMERTANGMGITTDDLAHMTAVEQLYWVEKYFRRYAAQINSLSDMYMAILLPKYIGSPETEILFSDPTIGYRQNSKLDFNSDGKITKAEATERVAFKLARGLQKGNVWVYS